MNNHRRRFKDDNPSEVVIPITPMLDMAFQLLTFFIFTYNPSGMEGAMDMSLPAEVEKAAATAEDVQEKAPDAEKPPEFPSDLTVRVRAQGGKTAKSDKGDVGGLAVVKIGAPEHTISGEDPEEVLGKLTAYLKQLRQDEPSLKEGVKVDTDPLLKVSAGVAVMDACRKAGFPKVSFVAPPPKAAR